MQEAISQCRRLHWPHQLENLEQPGWLSRPIPAVDDQLLPLDRPATTADVVMDACGIHLEACKHAPNIRVVV